MTLNSPYEDHDVRRDLSLEHGYAPADRPPHDGMREPGSQTYTQAEVDALLAKLGRESRLVGRASVIIKNSLKPQRSRIPGWEERALAWLRDADDGISRDV